MALDISITTVLKYFLESKSAKRERIADYLDKVAADAKGLAEIWREILIKYNQGVDDPSGDKKINRKIDELVGIFMRQTYHFSSLNQFYYELSDVIGGRTKVEFQDNFMFSLGALLERRNFARREAEKMLAHTKQQIFLNDENTNEDIQNLESVVSAIQKEAAALEVLAKTFRASI
jgi:hypothetical protein